MTRLNGIELALKRYHQTKNIDELTYAKQHLDLLIKEKTKMNPQCQRCGDEIEEPLIWCHKCSRKIFKKVLRER